MSFISSPSICLIQHHIMTASTGKRRRAGRARTGCGTCRIRRIKCDETHPDCLRCSNTGRKCDGYITDITIPHQTQTQSHSQISKTSTTTLIPRIFTHIPGTTHEKRGFEFFLWNTASELSGYYSHSFWEQLILAASVQKPALRYAVVALGSLHEEFLLHPSSPCTSSTSPTSSTTPMASQQKLASTQYTKAITALRRSLANGNEEPITALLSCILFISFDSLRGNYEGAMLHLQSGLKILKDMRKSGERNDVVENEIAPMLQRLSIQSIIFVETKSWGDKKMFALDLEDVSGKGEKEVIGEFESLEQARKSLDRIVDGLFRGFYLWDADLPLHLQSTSNIHLFTKCTIHLAHWNTSFSTLMTSKSQNFTNRQIQSATLLKIHHLTSSIMVAINPTTRDSALAEYHITGAQFLPFTATFRIVLDLCKALVAAASNPIPSRSTQDGNQCLSGGGGGKAFTTEFGIIGPLYYICINCQDPQTKEEAMELLMKTERREGMWDSGVIGNMMGEFWEMGEGFRKISGDGKGKAEFTDGGLVHQRYFKRESVL